MPVDYVSDYEAVHGVPVPSVVEVKVIASPTVETPTPATVAETKKVKATR